MDGLIKWSTLIIVLIVACVVVCGAVSVISSVLVGQTGALCLHYGYPNSGTAYYPDHIERYCIKRVNNTDVVVPLSELQGAK